MARGHVGVDLLHHLVRLVVSLSAPVGHLGTWTWTYRRLLLRQGAVRAWWRKRRFQARSADSLSENIPYREREREKPPARAALTCRSLGDRARTLAIHNKTRHRTCESGGATLTSWYPRRAGRRTGQIIAQRIASASAITGHAPAFRSPALNARSPTSFFSAATSSFALTSAGVLSGIATMFYGAKDQRRRKQGMLIDAEG